MAGFVRCSAHVAQYQNEGSNIEALRATPTQAATLATNTWTMNPTMHFDTTQAFHDMDAATAAVIAGLGLPPTEAPAKKEVTKVVDPECLARVIAQLDMPKDDKLKLAMEFAEALVEMKPIKFNRDSFIQHIQEKIA